MVKGAGFKERGSGGEGKNRVCLADANHGDRLSSSADHQVKRE